MINDWINNSVEPFRKNVCMFDIDNCSIDWLKKTISITFIDNYSWFWVWIGSAILSMFLNNKTNVVTNLKPFNWVYYLSCSSGLKKLSAL